MEKLKVVHQFPEDKSLRNILAQRRDDLQELYDTLNRAYALAANIEEKVEVVESEYNHFLHRYSKCMGGIENVEVGFLEYGSEISIDTDEGTIVFKPWTDEDEEEEDY